MITTVDDRDSLLPTSQLFTLRLWIEGTSDGRREARMQVKDVQSGETRYFREWAAVVEFMLAKLEQDEPPPLEVS